MTIRLETKLPEEVRRYRHDWSQFLGTDTIVSEVTTVVAPSVDAITVDTTIEDDDQSVIFEISGGEIAIDQRFTETITTAAGNEETETFVLSIGHGEPIGLTEAKNHLNVQDTTIWDSLISTLIPSARAFVEKRTGYSLVEGKRTQTFNAWGDYLEVYQRPILSIDAIVYDDESGAAAEYDVDAVVANLNRFPLRIYPAVDTEFPGLADPAGSVTLQFTTDALSETSREYLIAKRAMLLLIAHWFDNRGETADVPESVIWLLEDLTPLSVY